MTRLFAYCSNLTTIYISDLWNTDKVTSSTQMFVSTTRLRNFNSSYTDKTRANYSSTGYLTFKSPTRIDISIPKALYINNLSDSTSAISTSATATNHGSSTNQTTRKINIPGVSIYYLLLIITQKVHMTILQFTIKTSQRKLLHLSQVMRELLQKQ